MGWLKFGLRKTFKFGAMRLTVTHKGATVGAKAGPLTASAKVVDLTRRREKRTRSEADAPPVSPAPSPAQTKSPSFITMLGCGMVLAFGGGPICMAVCDPHASGPPKRIHAPFPTAPAPVAAVAPRPPPPSPPPAVRPPAPPPPAPVPPAPALAPEVAACQSDDVACLDAVITVAYRLPFDQAGRLARQLYPVLIAACEAPKRPLACSALMFFEVRGANIGDAVGECEDPPPSKPDVPPCTQHRAPPVVPACKAGDPLACVAVDAVELSTVFDDPVRLKRAVAPLRKRCEGKRGSGPLATAAYVAACMEAGEGLGLLDRLGEADTVIRRACAVDKRLLGCRPQ